MNSLTSYLPKLEPFLDLPVNLTIELGTCQQLTRDVLRLAAGSVVALDRHPGGQVSLFVEHRLFARGELVLAEGNLAIKITSISSEDGSHTTPGANPIA